jgi:hypothetical protein
MLKWILLLAACAPYSRPVVPVTNPYLYPPGAEGAWDAATLSGTRRR